MIHTFILFQTFGDDFSCLTDPNCSITSDGGKVPQLPVIWSCLSKIHFSPFCTDTCLPLLSCVSLLVLCFLILLKSLLSLLLLFCFFFHFSTHFLVFSLFFHLTLSTSVTSIPYLSNPRHLVLLGCPWQALYISQGVGFLLEYTLFWGLGW